MTDLAKMESLAGSCRRAGDNESAKVIEDATSEIKALRELMEPPINGWDMTDAYAAIDRLAGADADVKIVRVSIHNCAAAINMCFNRMDQLRHEATAGVKE